MTDSLNQADVDALLGAIGPTLDAATELDSRSGPRRSVSAYDFSHPDLLSREQIRSVRTLHEGYAQALAKRLSTELLTNVSASVAAVDQLTYGEFLMLLPAPTLLSVIEVSELDGNVAIEIDPGLSFAFIDRLLGGVGDPLESMRPLTAIEQGLMSRVLRRCCRELELTWAPLTSLQFRLQSIETNPELARVVGANEMVVLLTLQLRMNDVRGTMHLCLPYVVMEPALHRMAQGTRYPRTAGGSPERVRAALAESLRASRVTVDVDLGTAELTVREMLGLAPGDVLRVRPAAESGAEAKIEGVPRLRGAPGRLRGRAAFEVQEAHPEERREEGTDAGSRHHEA